MAAVIFAKLEFILTTSHSVARTKVSVKLVTFFFHLLFQEGVEFLFNDAMKHGMFIILSKSINRSGFQQHNEKKTSNNLHHSKAYSCRRNFFENYCGVNHHTTQYSNPLNVGSAPDMRLTFGQLNMFTAYTHTHTKPTQPTAF